MTVALSGQCDSIIIIDCEAGEKVDYLLVAFQVSDAGSALGHTNLPRPASESPRPLNFMLCPPPAPRALPPPRRAIQGFKLCPRKLEG